jgi:carboxymethylenebutenolidase
MPIKCESVRYGDRTGYFACPERAKGPLPSVIVVSEVMGLNDQIEDVARRLAAAGYAVLAPDLYAKGGVRPEALRRARVDEAMAFMETMPPAARFDKAARDAAMAVLPEDERARILESFGAIFSMINFVPTFVDPLREAVAYLRSARPESAGRKVGCVGFCMGGGLAALLACEEPQVSAAAVYYGTPPAAEKLDGIACPVIGFFGELDQRVNAGIPAFEKAMAARGESFESHVYKGANHGFFNDSGPAYAVDAARDSFARLLGFFANHLTS